MESRERVEVKIPDAVTVTAEADLDVAEISESVEHYGEEISDVAGVCGGPMLLEFVEAPCCWGLLRPHVAGGC